MGLGAQVDDALCTGAPDHPEALLRMVPLVHDEVVLEGLGAEDASARLVRQEFGPATGRLQGRGHHPEVFGLQVRHDDELIAPMIDVIFEIGCALENGAWRCSGLIGGNQ